MGQLTCLELCSVLLHLAAAQGMLAAAAPSASPLSRCSTCRGRGARPARQGRSMVSQTSASPISLVEAAGRAPEGKFMLKGDVFSSS